MTPGTGRAQLKALTLEIAALLRRERLGAILTGRDRQVSLDGERRVLVGDGGDVVAVPSDVVVDVLGATNYVDGTSDGRALPSRRRISGRSAEAFAREGRNMRFVSIGIRAASRSRRAEARKGRADRRSGGFTLIEALVALALVLAFAAALDATSVPVAPHRGRCRYPHRRASAAAHAARCALRSRQPGAGHARRETSTACAGGSSPSPCPQRQADRTARPGRPIGWPQAWPGGAPR